MQAEPVPQLVSDPALWRWLIGQSVALALAVVWIVTLLRDNLASRMRNEALSDYLVQSTENASRDALKRSEQHVLQLDSTQRAVTESYTRVLERALTLPARSSRRSGHESGEPG